MMKTASSPLHQYLHTHLHCHTSHKTVITFGCIYEKMDFHSDKVTVFYSACHSNKSLLGYYTMFIFITQPLNSKTTADGWSYFYFKCPCPHLHKTAFSLSAVNSYCPVCVIQVTIINVFCHFRWRCCLYQQPPQTNSGTLWTELV